MRLLLASSAIAVLLTACNPSAEVAKNSEEIGRTSAELNKLDAKADELNTKLAENRKADAEQKAQMKLITDEVAELKQTLADIKRNMEERDKRPAGTPDQETARKGALAASKLIDEKVRSAACSLLALFKDKECNARLIQMLRHDPNERVRRTAMEHAVRLKLPGLARILTDLVLESNDANIRQTAANGLSQMPVDGLADDLIRGAERLITSTNYTDRYTRRYLYQAMAKVVETKHFNAVNKLYKKESDDYRSYALTALVKCCDDAKALGKLIASEQNSRTRRALVEQLYRDPKVETVRPLLDLCEKIILSSNYDDRYARRYIYQIVEKVGTNAHAAQLQKLAEQETSHRSYAQTALAKIVTDPKTIIKMYRDSTDSHRRRRYLERISTTATKDSAPQLIELAKDLQKTNDSSSRGTIYQALLRVGTKKEGKSLLGLLNAESDTYQVGQLALVLYKCSDDPVQSFAQVEPKVFAKALNSRSVSSVLARKADIRLSSNLADALPLTSDTSTVNSILSMLTQLKDPVVAEKLIKNYDAAKARYLKRYYQQFFDKGYPGVVYDANTQKATLVGAEDMKKLMDARKARLDKLQKKVPAKKE